MVNSKKVNWGLIIVYSLSVYVCYLLYWQLPVWIFGASKVILAYKIVLGIICIYTILRLIIFEPERQADNNNMIFTDHEINGK